MNSVYNINNVSQCVICICIFLSCHLEAQQNDFPFQNFQNITTREGLPHNDVPSLIQDHNGFMWFATYNGLCRYDGYEFKNYRYNSSDSNSISPGWYYCMFEDKDGILWMFSSTQGFFSFNPLTEKFKRFHHEPGNFNSLAADHNEGGFVQDSSGIIWIATSAGLNSFNPRSGKFELYTHNPADSTSLSSNNLTYTCIDENNILWLTAFDNTINCFDTKTKKVIKHYYPGSNDLPKNKKSSSLTISDRSRNGNILIATGDNGFYKYNIHSKTWAHFTHEENNPFSLSSNNVSWVYEDSHGNFWINIISYGLDFYESKTGKFYHTDLKSPGHSSSSDVAMFLEDKEGKVWMATQNNGIITCEPVFRKFKSVRHHDGDKYSIASDNVTSIFQKQPRELFIGCGNGISIFDIHTKTIKPFVIIENNSNIFENNLTLNFYYDRNKTLWLCTLNGLFSYDEKTKQHHSYRSDEKDSTTLGAHSAPSILQDSSGNYWISTFGGGLNYLDAVTGKIKQYRLHNGKNSLSSNSLVYILKDEKGIFNIGSWNGGLITFNPQKEIFKNFLHNSLDSTSVSCDLTHPFFQDEHGIIWLGTTGGGLNVFNPASGKFRAFTVADGLPENTVISLIRDYEGQAWGGTFKGLICFKLPENPFDKNCKIQFRNYDISDGLPSNDMNYYCAFKGDDGNLYFGTSNAGFFYFNPKEFTDNKFIPPVYITSFKLMNKDVSENDSGVILKTSIEFTKEIALDYKQNIISFTFAALNFIHPEKYKYAYMLENYDKNWIYTDASKRFATYTNLDPGEYIFKVKGSNNDGVWNEKPTELKIIITPPFWKTVWFNILAVLILAGIAYKFYRYRIGQILLLQSIRNKIASDLHDDIGSTLNSISVYSEVARMDFSRRDHALAMIGESSRKVIDSLSDIVWTINPENDSFDKIILRMRTHSYNLLKAKKIDCTFKADESLNEIKLPMEIRRNFYLIFKEALNNLVKYSGAKRTSILISQDNRAIILIIRDDGIGFDRNLSYNGNGLNNMKRRAQEITAVLNIDSAIGKGTSIELYLIV